jgi:hypothetical protein
MALGPLAHELRQPIERGIGPQQLCQQLVDRLGAERCERDLAVVGPRRPGGVVLGAEIEDGEALRPLDRLDVVGEECLGRRVEPVQVLEQVDARPTSPLGVNEALHDTQQLALARLRVHPRRWALGVGHREEVEDQGQVVVEALVQ